MEQFVLLVQMFARLARRVANKSETWMNAQEFVMFARKVAEKWHRHINPAQVVYVPVMYQHIQMLSDMNIQFLNTGKTNY